MSTDAVLYVVTDLHRDISLNCTMNADCKAGLLLSLDCMRGELKEEDVEGFNRVVDQGLRHYPDRYAFLLEVLFHALSIKDRDALSRILTGA